MNEYDFKSPLIVLAACMFTGLVIQYFIGLFWLGSGFLIFSILLSVGLMADSDSRSEGALYDASNETEHEILSHEKSMKIHKSIICTSILCAFLAFYI